jgi:hypothetical protein
MVKHEFPKEKKISDILKYLHIVYFGNSHFNLSFNKKLFTPLRIYVFASL